MKLFLIALLASLVLSPAFAADQVITQIAPDISTQTKLPLRVALVGIMENNLKEKALDLYRRVFRTVYLLPEAPPRGIFDLTVTPAIRELRFNPNLTTWGSTPTSLAVTDLLVMAGEKQILQKTYQSAEYAEFTSSASVTGATIVTEKAIMDNMIAGLSDIIKHPALQRLIPGLRADMLVRACEAEDIQKAASMLLLGDDPNVVDSSGWTPLMAAAFTGRTDTVKVLLSSGANPNSTARDGATPLIMTALKGHVDAAKALISAGANPKKTMKNGKTALSLARERKQIKMVALLQGKYDKADKPAKAPGKGEKQKKRTRSPEV